MGTAPYRNYGHDIVDDRSMEPKRTLRGVMAGGRRPLPAPFGYGVNAMACHRKRSGGEWKTRETDWSIGSLKALTEMGEERDFKACSHGLQIGSEPDIKTPKVIT